MWVTVFTISFIVFVPVGLFFFLRGTDKSPKITISFQTDGDEYAQYYRMPRRLWWTLITGSVVFVFLVIILLVLSPEVTRQLAQERVNALLGSSLTDTLIYVRSGVDSNRASISTLAARIDSLSLGVSAVVTDSGDLLTVAGVRRDVELARQAIDRVADIEIEMASAKSERDALRFTMEGQQNLVSEVLAQTRGIIGSVGLATLALVAMIAAMAFSGRVTISKRPQSAQGEDGE